MTPVPAQPRPEPSGLRREPIVDDRLAVRGYALHHTGPDGRPVAPARVLLATLNALADGTDAGRPVLVDVDLDLAASVAALPVEAGTLVLQIDAAAVPADAPLDALAALRALGHPLALRVAGEPDRLRPELVALAAIAKLRLTPEDSAADLARRVVALRAAGLVVIAEQVDHELAFRRWRGAGAELFEGRFACRPLLVVDQSAREAPANLATIATLTRPDATFEELEEAIAGDPRLALGLLRLVGSAAFPSRRAITTVHDAITLLGTRAVRQWGVVLALAGLPVACDEIVVTALTRGHAVTELCERTGLPPDPGFAIGVLATADALTRVPLATALADLPLSAEIRAAVIDRAGPYGAALAAVVAFEDGAVVAPPGVAPADLLESCTLGLAAARSQVARISRSTTPATTTP